MTIAHLDGAVTAGAETPAPSERPNGRQLGRGGRDYSRYPSDIDCQSDVGAHSRRGGRMRTAVTSRSTPTYRNIIGETYCKN
jgi:hypothetical protein